MKRLLQNCGIFFVLYLGAAFFEILTRKYFKFNEGTFWEFGKDVMDFSLYAWGAMLLLWGVALWREYKGKNELVQFAVFFSLTCAAFVCCQYYLLTGNEMYGISLRIILGLEAGAALLFIIMRRRFLAFLSVSSFVLAFISPFIIFPKIFPLCTLFTAAGSIVAVWLLSLVTKSEKWRYRVSVVGVVLLAAELTAAALALYLRVPGIRFYEAKVDAVPEVKISVIIPVYNGEEALERCLDSLRRQTMREIEIIVVDDGSTDKTPDILARYAAHDARIKVIRQENAYIGAARNNGLKHAKGEYVGFVDSDDWVSKDFYEKLYQKAKKENKDVVIVPEIRVMRQKGKFNEPEKTGKKVYSEEMFKTPFLDIHTQFIGYVWNKLYKREFLEKNNIFFTTYRTIYEDGYFHILLSLYLDYLTVADGGIYYYSKGERITVSTVDEHISPKDELLEMFEDLEKVVKKAPVNEEVRQNVQKFAQWRMFDQLQYFYNLLKKEDREAFLLKCESVYGKEKCQFKEPEEDVLHGAFRVN